MKLADKPVEFRIAHAELRTRYSALYHKKDSSKGKDVNDFTLKDEFGQGAITFKYDEKENELNISTGTFTYFKDKDGKEDHSKPTFHEGNFVGTLELYDIDTGKAIGFITFSKDGKYTMDQALKDDFAKGEFSTTIKVNGKKIYTPKEVVAPEITAPKKKTNSIPPELAEEASKLAPKRSSAESQNTSDQPSTKKQKER